ncbi:MAG: hypothetical protein BZY80_00975 [SAR202 cluster bacterium Io17-Chloro-G2]|nr:MAG: hypothetical protein BZY80_00975 [SAR202 cluster bacterium Io17-Chloro-G2]
MPNITSIQQREARSNQMGGYSDYNQHFAVDQLELTLSNGNRLKIFFQEAGSKYTGGGLILPLNYAKIIATSVNTFADDSPGLDKITIKLT